MQVGEYIKQLRLAKGMTQEQLGDCVGIQRAAVQKWESGQTQNLKRSTIITLAKVFNVSPSTFITCEDNTERDVEFDLKTALWGDRAEQATDSMLEDVKRYAAYIMDAESTQ